MASGRIEQEIVVKVIGGKDVGALDKQIKALEKTKAEIVVTADVDDAQKKIDAIDAQLAELRGEKAELEITAKVNQALDALDTVAAEAKKSAAAAEALSGALGPELAGKADLDGIIADFQRMGFSLEEITANADRLGGKLREVGQKDVSGRLTTGFSKIDSSAKSAGSSASVLANAIGNTAQDLGATAGLAGTAGVALGQMGEYMADAALSGEALSVVLTNFAKVAGPIAAITAVLGVVQGVMQSNEERAKAAAEATKQYGDAMDKSANDAVGLSDVLRDNTDKMHDFSGAATETGEILKDVASNIPLIGGLFKAPTVDVTQVLNEIGVGFFEVGKAISGNVHAWDDIHTKLDEFHDLGQITDDQLNQTTKFINEQRDAVKNAEETQHFQNIALGEANALYDELLAKKKPLEEFPEQWNKVFDAIRDGTLDSQRATTAINFLANQLGLAPSDVLALALGEVDKKADEASKALEDNAKATEKWAKAQQKAADDAAQAFADAQISIDDMASSFNTMARHEDAIKLAFDLGNAPLEARQAVVDINDAIRDLGEFIKKEGTPFGKKGAFNPRDVDAGPFLDKIKSLRTPIQQAVADAFSAPGGGQAAGEATADAYVKQIVASLHGKLTKDQVRNLLGLDDLTATLKVAVDQESMATAEGLLEALTGLQGETPWTVQLKLALEAGTLSADAAKVIEGARLTQLGVDVPLALTEPTQGSKTAAKAAADRWMADHKVDMQTKVSDPSLQALIDARNAGQDDADKMPITFPSTVAPPTIPWYKRLDAGGTAGPGGGIAGERGPEILDERYLTTGPTYVPPGTRVTSRVRTTQILRTRGTQGLRRYDSGGVVGGPTTMNINVNTAVVGNRYDVARSVRKAGHDIIRLYGSRG